MARMASIAYSKVSKKLLVQVQYYQYLLPYSVVVSLRQCIPGGLVLTFGFISIVKEFEDEYL